MTWPQAILGAAAFASIGMLALGWVFMLQRERARREVLELIDRVAWRALYMAHARRTKPMVTDRSEANGDRKSME